MHRSIVKNCKFKKSLFISKLVHEIMHIVLGMANVKTSLTCLCFHEIQFHSEINGKVLNKGQFLFSRRFRRKFRLLQWLVFFSPVQRVRPLFVH